MSASGAGRTDSLAEQVKVCNTCGDAGFDDCLAFCTHCNEGAEHVYCMVTVFDTVPSDWICEGCKVRQRENNRKRKLVCDGFQPIQAHKKQVLSDSLSAKSMGLSCISSIKKESSENGTDHFATMQTDEAPSKGPACHVPSMGGVPFKEKSLAERDKLPFSNMLMQKPRTNISNEKYPARIIASDVSKPSHPVISGRGISAKVSLCSETDRLVSTSRCKNDMKKITRQDLPSVSPESFTETISTLSNSQSASVVVRTVKEASCLAEPLECVFVQDTATIAIETKVSGKEVGSEEQELSNVVSTSLAKGKQLYVKAEPHNLEKTVASSLSSVAKPLSTDKEEMEVISGAGKLFEAEHHNLNKASAFSSSSLAKPVATSKKLMEVTSRTGKLVPTDRTASLHTTSMAGSSINADAEIPKHTLSLIGRPTCNPQVSTISNLFVKSESMVVASGLAISKVAPVCTTAPIRTASIVPRKNVNTDADVPNDIDIAIEKLTSSTQGATINCMFLKLESMKGTSSSGTGSVVSACVTAPFLTEPQHAIVDSTPVKNESDEIVKRSRLHAPKVTRRDFPIITQKIEVLGEKGEKIFNFKSKGKLLCKAVAPPGVEGLSCSSIPGGNVVKEVTATGQEINGSGNKFLAKEEVNIIGGSIKSFNLFCEGEEHHRSGVVLVKGMITGQETDGSHNRLKAKEEEIAISAVEIPSFFVVEEKALLQNVMHKGGVAGSQSCLISESCLTSGSAECPSLFSKEQKTQPQNVKQKGLMPGLPSCLMSGSAEPPSEEEKEQPRHVKQKGGAAGSPSYLVKNSGLGKLGFCSRTAPTHSVLQIERNVEPLISSPCTEKGPSCEVVPRQENSMSVASADGVDNISSARSKRVVRRDFPPLKALFEKVRKIVGPIGKEKVVTPLKDKEQATWSRSDADTGKITSRDVPAIAPEGHPVGNLAGVMMPVEDVKRLSCPGDVSTKQIVSIGVNIKTTSKRPEAEEEVVESKESATFPLRSLDTGPEVKECHGNAKQECDGTCLASCETRELPTGLASCITRELPTNGVSSSIEDEVASVIKTVPTSFASASKRKPAKKNLSSPPCKEGSSTKGTATLKCAKGPPCLPGQMERFTVKDTSNIQINKREVSARGRLYGSDGSSILLTSSIEGECVEEIEGHHILRQKGEALEAVAASACQVRSFSNVPSAEGKIMRDLSKAPLDKVAFTGRRLSSMDGDHDFAGRDYLDKVKISPGRHASRSQCAFTRSTCMMDGSEQLSFFEPRLKDSPRRNKGTVRSSISSTRDRHENPTYIERDFEDDGFHARREDAGSESSDRMGLRKSTLVRPRHHNLPDRDLDFRSAKQDHYPRGSRHQASESSSYKGAYRCHRCDVIGHSAEFCKADGQKEQRTPFSSDFEDRDLDLGPAKRDFTRFQVSNGRQWRYDLRREDRFLNSRSQIESNAVDCVRMCSKRPPNVSEHARYDEERRYRFHLREEEASFERAPSRLQVSYSLNGMKSELKPSTKQSTQSEYTRVHKGQIVRAQTQDNCKADTHFESEKAFPVQCNASSFPDGPEATRGGYVNRSAPSQAPLIPQDQICKDRISQNHVASLLHGSRIRNFAHERRAAPDRQVMWTGCFNVFSKTGWETCYQGFQARPSNVAHSKVFEALLALPSRLKMEEKKRGVETDSWPRSFQESPPTSHSIGIYFFSTDLESYGKWYKPLLHRLAARDLVLKVKLEFAQLLIFPSHILPEAEQCWEDRPFLWGIFKRNVEESSHLLWQPACRDPGSDLGSPTGNGEVIDTDVDMVGGKDAVSQEWQEFNPPLPPGFPPAPPYPS